MELNRDAARFYYELLHDKRGEACAEYLNQRRITRRTAVNFWLGASADEWDGLLTAMARKGYSKVELLAAGLVVQGKGGSVYDKFRKRLIFPSSTYAATWSPSAGASWIKTTRAQKYMNSPETIIYSKRRVLYGLNLAKKSKRENIILVEGNIDVVMLHQAGFDNACASMGTALTTEQIRLLSRYTKGAHPLLRQRQRRTHRHAEGAGAAQRHRFFPCACSSFPTASWTGSRSSRTRTTLSRIRPTPSSGCSAAAKRAWTSAWRGLRRALTSRATRAASTTPPQRQNLLCGAAERGGA